MKTNAVPSILGIGVLGLLLGHLGKTIISEPGDDASVRNGATTRVESAERSFQASTDTLEQLIVLEDETLYTRLARWLVMAEDGEIAGFWESYLERDFLDPGVLDLILINWTRVHPQGAIIAAREFGDEKAAWRAWACNDPEAALAAAADENSECLHALVIAVGNHHPAWLREHFDLIPESARDVVLSGTFWNNGVDPFETMEFLISHERFDRAILGSMIRQDPWEAWGWYQENDEAVHRRFGGAGWAMDSLTKSMGEWHPDALEQLASQTPSGLLKRKMNAALFDQLIKRDPEAAAEQAKSIEAPEIAAECLSKIGMHYVDKDPEKAIEFAELLFSVSGSPSLRFPDGPKPASGGNTRDSYRFMNELIAKMPDKLMDIAIANGDVSNRFVTSFSHLAQRWAQDDLDAYSDWVNNQSDPVVWDQGAGYVVGRLRYKRRYAEAAEWVMSTEEVRSRHLESVLRSWREDEPDRTIQWLEAQDLPEEEKQRLIKSTKPFGS